MIRTVKFAGILACALLVGTLQTARASSSVAPTGLQVSSPVDDSRFDRGSGIEIHDLSQAQIRNLVTLGKVWGFLKYHHPVVTSGNRQWDYELLRVLPEVLKAKDSASSNAAIASWIDALGPVARCKSCATLDKADLQLSPDLSWISDTRLLGDVLSRKLQWIYDQRSGAQYYVDLAAGVLNPTFKHELTYGDVPFPDAGFQLLALFLYWNIIEYWYPNRAITGEDWNKVLATSIAGFALAGSDDAYKLQVMQLIARVNDTHANLWSSLDIRPPVGECNLPFRLRFVENQLVVTTGLDGAALTTPGFKAGDIVTHLNGRSVADSVREWRTYYADSNEAARQRDMANYFGRGPCSDVQLTVRRGNHTLQANVARVILPGGYRPIAFHDRPGPAFQWLSPEVAYLKLSTVNGGDAAAYIEQAAGTKALIIDARNYPSSFMVFKLGSLLVDRPTAFVRFTVGDLSNPGSFHWTQPLTLEPGAHHYGGKIVVLVDEVSQSQAEYTTMAFRSVPGAIVVGSTTAGADGNLSKFPLPGNLSTAISGIGVFYPDKRPTQRVGIIPDVVVKPTIASIREGRDLVLDEALRLVRTSSSTASGSSSMHGR